MMVYITDHVEKRDEVNFKLSAFDIINHYRNKYIIENAFREMKSFLDLRPFYVRTEEHVKAHYDIGVIAYFINNYIYDKLSSPYRDFDGFIKLVTKQFSKDVAQLKIYLKEQGRKIHEMNDSEDIISFVKNAAATKKLSADFTNIIEEYCSSTSIRKFYKDVKDSSNAVKLASPQGVEIYKMKALATNVKGYLSRLNMAFLASPSTHTSLGIYQ
jgi:hypothetical protein